MQTIQETVASVQNAPGSMYTREDVISLLNKIQVPTASAKIDQQVIKDLFDAIRDEVKDNASNLDSSDVVDSSTAEFSLNYNEVQLDSVDIDTDNIADAVVRGLYDTIEEFFMNLNEEEDENEEDENTEDTNN
jgi:hypothetical protein